MIDQAANSTAYLGIGSNLGDRLATMRAAVLALHTHPSIQLEPNACAASLYESTPVGVASEQRVYYNSTIRVATTLAPYQLLDAVLAIENALGRVRREPMGSRTIDLDLLLYDDLVINDETLTVPHPRMHLRRFVLEPLAEIAGSAVHPTCGATIAELAGRTAGQEFESIHRVMDARWVTSGIARPGQGESPPFAPMPGCCEEVR
ncbi:MAG: 2-amino-4-hydroxy-6-hydroxymethyldihydropteridine diphosphokinase [Phycisphaerales bacterium]|nr:MAG: 2-amino-4-hydroxy-6-hydroxymethyldihydropteridine diphosphokinase [Phycisphaerales bacterium]